MPDQLLRDELMKSDRWLDLPNDTCRLAFFPLLLVADDFGNLEAGIRRIFRLWEPQTQIKTIEAAAVALAHLMDADLTRGYVADNREFLHVPRFKSHRSYLVRKCPPSPWCDPEKALGKHVRKVINQGLAKNLPATLLERNSHVLLGVEVGVGVEVDKKRTSTAVPVDKSEPAKAQTWAEHWKAEGKAFGIEPLQGEKAGDYCRRIQAWAKEHGK